MNQIAPDAYGGPLAAEVYQTHNHIRGMIMCRQCPFNGVGNGSE